MCWILTLVKSHNRWDEVFMLYYTHHTLLSKITVLKSFKYKLILIESLIVMREKKIKKKKKKIIQNFRISC